MEQKSGMSDTISRQAALKVACGTCQFVSCPGNDKCDEYEAMKNLPSVDAVEVVRCKDCIFYDSDMICNVTDTVCDNDDFCSYGDRREDGEA